ncbi:hypothetical protein HOK68_04950 [Candidatus Woesearchaeota archaeon]|jgi:hypothetical protein|nr:hypothetical protein [Candidatus Woesearchaeota archaeon]MBT4387336.1 hypothetical protein [Candidatus Woesearchaeota archaeon]MBT4595475.1 hypothetical protein [Candidatus Woesearchaeota archaeon]MBT5740834.1 hypothetical protein [Candidatus Woesearchaeota archaeon]MBT6506096.1 hypothetical protein [Candidatus Woesearchaeota archaeon]
MVNLTSGDITFAVTVGAVVGIIWALKYLIRLEQKLLNVEVHVEHIVDQLRYNELNILDEQYKIEEKLGINTAKKNSKSVKKPVKKKVVKKTAKKVTKKSSRSVKRKRR